MGGQVFLTLVAIVFFGSSLYCVLFPLFAMRVLTNRFDGDLLNERYWSPGEQALPFPRYRRAGLYALAVASSWIARRRFGDYPFQSHLGRGLRILCRVFALTGTLLIGSSLVHLVLSIPGALK